MNDMDHPMWIALSGLFILAVSAIMLWGNYCQWEPSKDLLTASAITTAYFVQAITKRMVRKRKEKQNEDAG